MVEAARIFHRKERLTAIKDSHFDICGKRAGRGGRLTKLGKGSRTAGRRHFPDLVTLSPRFADRSHRPWLPTLSTTIGEQYTFLSTMKQIVGSVGTEREKVKKDR